MSLSEAFSATGSFLYCRGGAARPTRGRPPGPRAGRVLCQPRRPGPRWSSRPFSTDPARMDQGPCAPLVSVLYLQPVARLRACEIKQPGVWGHEGFFKGASEDSGREEQRPGGRAAGPEQGVGYGLTLTVCGVCAETVFPPWGDAPHAGPLASQLQAPQTLQAARI